jgi:hypothetical protein
LKLYLKQSLGQSRVPQNPRQKQGGPRQFAGLSGTYTLIWLIIMLGVISISAAFGAIMEFVFNQIDTRKLKAG